MVKRNDRIGMTATATNGMTMKILDYRKYSDIDIEFEDGIVVRNKSYDHFASGKIAHPDKNVQMKRNCKVGEMTTANNGMSMKIIACRKYEDIDVQFADGAIAQHKSYFSFRKGEIAYPDKTISARRKTAKSRIGMISQAKNGLKMEIIEYRNAKDIDIRFEDGTVVQHRTYSDFQIGQIAHPNPDLQMKHSQRVGEEGVAVNGMRMKIFAYRTSGDIDVQFEDGVVVCNKTYSDFKKGMIGHPGKKEEIEARTGETAMSVCGIKMKLVNYHSFMDVDVEFEDGSIAKHKTYQRFLKGSVGHPCMNKNCTSLVHSLQVGEIKATERAYVNENVAYFICSCKKCGMKDILSVPEMREHECE